VNRSHRALFCLGSRAPEAIEHQLSALVQAQPKPYVQLIFNFFLKIRSPFGLGFGLTRGHMLAFCLGSGKNRW